MLEFETYIRKPFKVSAIRITDENMEEVAKHFNGRVEEATVSDKSGSSKSVKRIKVPVHRPATLRQSRAYSGDWILETDGRLKVYTNKALHKNFDVTSAKMSINSLGSDEKKYEQMALEEAISGAVEELRVVNVPAMEELQTPGEKFRGEA